MWPNSPVVPPPLRHSAFANSRADIPYDPIDPSDDALEESLPPSNDSLPQGKRQRQRQTSVLESAADVSPPVNNNLNTVQESPQMLPEPSPSPEELEEEASSEGAFNPETGEINWDCPCLGGMAHGPCGEQFKAAFSCFVFSKEEPKGMDCIENFKTMQDCFREHPDVYKGELEEDDETLDEGLAVERAELGQEVAERKRALQERQRQGGSQGGAPQKKLVNEMPAPGQVEPQPEASAILSPAQSKPQDIQDDQRPASSEPHPGMSEDHEVAGLERRKTMRQGRPSQMASQSPPKMQSETYPAVEKFDEDLDLMPRAWHDGRGVEDASSRNAGK